MPMFKIQG